MSKVTKDIDFLIVGQGLAGSILGWMLDKLGKKIAIADNLVSFTSSKVAAGLYNPITGRKMVKTWNADRIFPVIEPFYQKIGQDLGTQILFPIGIYRPFFSIEEQNEWQSKVGESSFQPYIQKVSSSPHPSGLLNDPYGGLALNQAGFVDTKLLVQLLKTYFENKGLLSAEQFQFDEVNFSEYGVEYGEVSAKWLIVCTGPAQDENNPFAWIPLQPLKGEILTIKFNGTIETIFNRGVFIVPIGENLYRVGSTYDWRAVNSGPTETGKQQLTEKLSKLFKGAYEIVDHVAGVRPASKDRRPIIGKHPEMPKTAVFNGFGTKGVSLIPYYAKQLIDYLEDGKDLEGEVNISRYYSLYSRSVDGS